MSRRRRRTPQQFDLDAARERLAQIGKGNRLAEYEGRLQVAEGVGGLAYLLGVCCHCFSPTCPRAAEDARLETPCVADSTPTTTETKAP